jgi:large subunit ribosomal protein L15
MPMQRRLPKRGFTPLTRKVYELVKIGQLEVFEAGSTVSIAELVSAGIITGMRDGVKVLADGELTKSLTVAAHKFSAAAKEKIATAGGTVQEL